MIRVLKRPIAAESLNFSIPPQPLQSAMPGVAHSALKKIYYSILGVHKDWRYVHAEISLAKQAEP